MDNNTFLPIILCISFISISRFFGNANMFRQLRWQSGSISFIKYIL